MRSGSKTLHWDTPMPNTQRAHADPKAGDGKAFIRKVARSRAGADGIKAADCNFQLVRDKQGRDMAVMMHWTTPAANGYTRVKTARGWRGMTTAERRRPASSWGFEGVRTWRRPNGERPMTYGEAVRYAASKGVVIVAELKSTRFASEAKMREMVAAAKRAGHPAWFMALYGSMRDCRGKCAATIDAGGQFQVIFGKHQKFARTTPPDWSDWVKPTRVSAPAKWSLR